MPIHVNGKHQYVSPDLTENTSTKVPEHFVHSMIDVHIRNFMCRAVLNGLTVDVDKNFDELVITIRPIDSVDDIDTTQE